MGGYTTGFFLLEHLAVPYPLYIPARAQLDGLPTGWPANTVSAEDLTLGVENQKKTPPKKVYI